MSFDPRFSITNSITQALTRIERARGFLEGLATQDYEALCPGVNRRTLQRDLKLLIEKGLLVERGSGPTDPTREYRLADDLQPRPPEL